MRRSPAGGDQLRIVLIGGQSAKEPGFTEPQVVNR
jgi:hypothetical protein